MAYEKTFLMGKSTDERIIICLEKTYPEHKFQIVEKFNSSIGYGIYADENGTEFKVHNILRNNNYHFACTDEYLNTLLEEQEYIKCLNEIDEKYESSISYLDTDVSIKVNLNESTDLYSVADMILDILNSVDTPQIVFPEKQGFSTGELNYYSYPHGDIIACDFVDEENVIREYVLFHFSDKEKSSEDIVQMLKDRVVESSGVLK